MTEANKEINVSAEVARGRAALQAARVLLASGLFDDAVARAYYAVFHHVQAVLLTEGAQARTHRGVHDLFFRRFVATGRIDKAVNASMSRLEGFRMDADYGRFFHFDAEDAARHVHEAMATCAVLERWLAGEGFAVPDGP